MENIRRPLFIPIDGKHIGDFAEELGNFYSERMEFFYRVEIQNVVCLMNTEFRIVNPSMFVTAIERYFSPGFERWTKQGIIFINRSINQNIAQIVLASQEQFLKKLPLIERIYKVPIPVIKEGKLCFPTQGYDSDLKSWLPFDAPQIEKGMVLDEARDIIIGLFEEFCFANEQDKINAIAALLTPFCRGLYNNETARTPIFFYEANRERAGKDYCAGITGIVFEGDANEGPAISSDGETHNDEFRKKVLAIFKNGNTRIHSSNNKGFINSTVLEALVTAEFWEDRVLGSNTNLKFKNILEISLSANTGITYTPDLAARCIFINLFFPAEDPNKRQFKNPDLHGVVRENRSKILSALYTFVESWFNNGMKGGSLPFASFPEWARVVGGVMENAGFGNPCVPNSLNEVGGDKETMNMKKLFELAYAQWPDQWIHVKDILYELEAPDSEFSDLFDYISFNPDIAKGKPARVKFGMLMRKFRGRELSGISLDFKEDKTHPTRNQYSFRKRVENVATMATMATNLNPLCIEKNLNRKGVENHSQDIQGDQIESSILKPNGVAQNVKIAPQAQNKRLAAIVEWLKGQPQKRAKIATIASYAQISESEALDDLKKLENSGDAFSPRPGEWVLLLNEVSE